MPSIGSLWLLNSIHSIFYVTTALLKSDVFSTQKIISPRVLDLQGWDSLQFEEE